MPDFVFKKMLEITKSFTPPINDDLNVLAKAMIKLRLSEDPKSHDSKIPAGYTYLGQFVDHDISLDSASGIMPWETIDLETVFNKRNPIFDLEILYGFTGEPDAEKMAQSPMLDPNSPFLKLGETSFGKFSRLQKSFFSDLPRQSESPVANIIDSRNDENLLIAQTHVAFIKFHNAVTSKIQDNNVLERFKRARQQTIRYYQHIVLYDLLPKIVKKSVLDDVIKNGNKIYDPKTGNKFIPSEYSVAAYRMGHSMIRSKYNVNSLKTDTSLLTLTIFTGSRTKRPVKVGAKSMMGKNSLPSDWLIDWNLFYDIDDSKTRFEKNFNFALKINTQISPPLGFTFLLRDGDDFRMASIPARDLYRGRLFGLPPGQMLAKAIAERIEAEAAVLPAEEVNEKIKVLLPAGLQNVFHDKTPLWFYILAEAEIEAAFYKENFNEEMETMGEIGSRIVAETLIGLLKESDFSILKDEDSPLSDEEKKFVGVTDGEFGMPEMLKFIQNETNHSFLNPFDT